MVETRPLTSQERIISLKQIHFFKEELEMKRYEHKRLVEDNSVGLPLTIRKKQREIDLAVRVKEEEIRELELKKLELECQIRDGVEVKHGKKEEKNRTNKTL